MKKYVLICLVIIASCKVGSEYKKPNIYTDETIKKELHLYKPYNHLYKWYTQFNDIQLDNLIDLGQRNNKDIKISISRLKQARVNYNITSANFLPIINGIGSWNYEKNSKNIGLVSNTHYYSIGFDSSWELDLWGKGKWQKEADYFDILANIYTLDNIKLLVTSEIILDYINLLLTNEKLILAQKNLSLQRKIFETVQNKYQNGLVDSASVSQAQYLVETTKSEIPSYLSSIEEYRNSLSIIVGILPSQLTINLGKSKMFKKEYCYNLDMVYNLPANAIKNRPDVRAAEQSLIAQNARVGEAVASLYPDVKLTALFAYSAKGARSLFNSRSVGYNYEPLISIPLLNWNKLKNNIELQKYIKEEALLEYEKTLLTAITELKNTMTDIENEVNTYNNLLKSLSAIEKTVSIMYNKFSVGLIEFSEFLNYEQKLIIAQNSVLESKSKILSNIVKYYKASGGIAN